MFNIFYYVYFKYICVKFILDILTDGCDPLFIEELQPPYTVQYDTGTAMQPIQPPQPEGFSLF